MNPIAYVMHNDTELQSVAYKIGSGDTHVIFGEAEIESWADSIDWSDKLVVGHNMSGFDSMICAWRLGITPKAWGCTLAMARPIFAKTTGVSLRAVSKALDVGEKLSLEATNTKGKVLEDFSEEEIEAMREYNKIDTDLCEAIFYKLARLTPKKEMKLIDMTTRMLVNLQFELDTELLQHTLQEERDQKRAMLLQVADSVTGVTTSGLPEDVRIEEAKKVLASAPKFSAFLKDNGLLTVPTKPSPTNPEKMIPALAKTDQAFIDLQEHENPVIAAGARARLGVKSTILETRMEKFLTVGRYTAGRMPIALSYYGAANTGRWCLTGDHEVLTKTGWVRLDQWGGGDIMQWGADSGELKYTPATANAFAADEFLVSYDNPRHSAQYTPEHTMPVQAHHSTAVVPTQAATVAMTRRKLFVAGDAVGADTPYTPDQLRLIVAMHADGCNLKDAKNNCVRFRLVKARKVTRLTNLLQRLGITHQKNQYHSEPDVTGITIRGVDAPSWLRAAKQFPVDWYALGASDIRVVLEELPEWDGYMSGPNSVEWTTTDEQGMVLISTLAHLASHRTTVRRVVDRTAQGWAVAWRVSYSPSRTLSISSKDVDRVHYKGLVYCPSTVTGYFLCRRNNSTFVTGNSGAFGLNQQNLPRVNPYEPALSDALRKSLRAPEGYKVVVADLSGIELRVNHFLWQVPSSTKLFEEDPDGADLYKDFASTLYDVSVDEVTKQQRQMGKLCLAEGSLVLTHKGLVPIEEVTTNHRLWDGVEWVSHKGAICNGTKEVITHDKVTATPDHRVYLQNGGSCELQEAANKNLRIAVTGDGGRTVGYGESNIHTQPSEVMQTKRRVWDILDAGPRHRFTCDGRLVSNCHLGLGFGAGADTFRAVAKTMGGVELSWGASADVVRAWRRAYPEIVRGWRTCHNALSAIYDGDKETSIDLWGLCATTPEGIETPVGMVRYPELSQEEDKENGRMEWKYGRGRKRARIYAGKVTENIVQHLARGVIADMALEFQRTELGRKYPLVHMVHDELIYVVKDEDAQTLLDTLQHIMKSGVDWWPELITSSEGDIAQTYGDAK